MTRTYHTVEQVNCLHSFPCEISLPIFAPAFQFCTPVNSDDASHTLKAASEAWQCWQFETGIDRLDLLIVVHSLPYPDGRLIGYELAEFAAIPTSRVVTLGNDCSTVIDALVFAAQSIAAGAHSILIVVSDRFDRYVDRETLKQKADTIEWKSASSAIAIGGCRTNNFYVRSLASVINPRFRKMLTIERAASGDALRFAGDVSFASTDIQAEALVIRSALGNIDEERVQFAFTNRSI